MRSDSGSRRGRGGEAVTRSISCRVTRREKSAMPASVTPAMAMVTRTKRRRRLILMALSHPLIAAPKTVAMSGLRRIAFNLRRRLAM